MLLCALPFIAGAQEGETSAIGGAIAAVLAQPDGTAVGGFTVDRGLLKAVYEPRTHRPAWLDGNGAPNASAGAAMQLLDSAGADGLNPQAYHAAAIEALAKPGQPQDAAAFELLLSDGLALYLHDMATGRTPVGQDDRDVTFVDGVDKAAGLNAALGLSPDDLKHYAEGLAPAEPDYKALKQALADLRAQQAQGGWQALPDGPTLKPGMSDASVPKLRQRLGVAAVPDQLAKKYDDQIVGAVKAFQETHAIKDDGTLGHDTREALNMPVEGRIAEAIAAMERWRWLPHDLGARYVMVDVGGFWTRYVENGQTGMQLSVIVGKAERETPLLTSTIEDVVINPSWTVPPTIIRKDLLPKMRSDPGFLTTKGIKLYRRTDDGLEEVSAASYQSGERYIFRQPPGDENPLGRFKLQFQNTYSIYMHDTPEQKKFAAALRTFSSGCIRVENVRQLVETLLAGQVSHEQVDDFLATDKTKTIRLDRPLPVYIDYFSAWLDPQGHMIFGPDLYDKDVNLAQQLQAAPGQ